MTTGYILVAAILILGGVIATVGDRLGTRVGKARLSLFNLRPRNTAVVITILTGSIISASTLAILFAADERLRTGVFELEEIQSELRDRRQQLEATTEEKTQVQQALVQARTEQRAEQREAQRREAEAQQRLEAINESLQTARAQQAQTQAQLNRTQARQAQTQAQLNRTQEQLSQVSAQFQQAQTRLRTVSQRAKELRAEIQQVQAELQQLTEQRDQLRAQIAKRDQEIAKLDESITQRDQVIAQRESLLKQLETQQNYLEQEAQNLERNLQVLRRGNVALFRGQVLAGGVVRIVDPKAARQAVDQLLGEANRTAVRFTQPGIEQNEQVVNISAAQVDQLIKQIDDGRDYVVRIMSAGNYVLGERSVQVIADAAQNQVVFRPGDVLAAISANPATMSDTELRQRVELLLGASNFRAQRAGILGDTIQIGDNRIETLIGFIDQLKQYNLPVEIQAVAAEVTYTSGPLKVELLAMQNGQVVFRT
ncbi:DUF3084 domain-containing protein [Gloeocapsopsis dulcis]|uniref:DUF3084 domain-containing protein n=1 Tax=Gloeocapsopsis dulcis AAB1 = 1H9 TaxID=1433147 RepID=A0A6N8FWG9_9CHRO|nr:DUF3084 domain-containing protein [Gloeocapsopsis dulcis]MUL36645.1 hypothetical protein [Gloeocapsopsis dulcis AAB1 = 1H9]WNN87271.1 DUF3084 domain-containing protein [Gloeocapsopsis dulcis]